VQLVTYIFFRAIVLLFSIIPFSLLYKLSDGIAFILARVIKYRFEVVLTNLRYVFPEKTEKEINEIAYKSYKNLSDIIVESIKGFSTNPINIYKRYPIPYPDFMKSIYESGRDTVCFAAHYNNWEWATYCTPLGMPFTPIGLIKPVRNKYINDYTNKKRCRTGTHVVSIFDTDKSIISKINGQKMMVYIADQNATHSDKSILIDFLGKPTYCLHGAEQIARNNNWPVFFGKVERLDRGKYNIDIILISENPSETKPTEITQACFKILEEQIRNKPENWLWTHKRWKRNNIY
jgi:KDO2-lipid IV(A) lauroyltransferase